MRVKYCRLWNVGMIILMFFVFLVCIASGSSYVEIIGEKHYAKGYHAPGDVVTAKVSIDKGIENAIKAIILKPSPESWGSQTLYSGGQRHWGSTITRREDFKRHISDDEEVKFMIPLNRILENQTVKLTFEVEYYYAELLRVGKREHVIYGERNFENKIALENFDLYLNIYSSEEKGRLIEKERLETVKSCLYFPTLPLIVFTIITLSARFIVIPLLSKRWGLRYVRLGVFPLEFIPNNHSRYKDVQNVNVLLLFLYGIEGLLIVICISFWYGGYFR